MTPASPHPWRTRIRRAGPCAAVMAAILAVEAYAWFGKRSGEVSYLPPDSALAAPVYAGGESTVVQTFVMHADGLQVIRIWPRAPTAPPAGTLSLELFDQVSGIRVARASIPAERVAAASPFEWSIPRVDRSAGRYYALVLSVPDAPPDRGLLFEVGAPRYTDGVLSVSGREVWGDLKFSTRAGRARTIDTIRDLRRQAPPWLRSELLFIGVWLAIHAALARVVYDLLVSAP